MTFGWTYVSILYSEGSYGTEGLWTMRKTLEVYGYCLAVTQIVKRNYGPEQYEVSFCILYHFQCSMAFLFVPSFSTRASTHKE